MNGAQLLLKGIEQSGTDVVFGYPGGAIMPVYDALHESSLRHVLVRHEQGAALAADGYARATGKVGVCMATSGPGATNLITGIANAFLDSVPIVAITGQVATPMMGTDAFQEVDIFGMTLPVVKHSFIVRSADDIPAIVCEAFKIAREGRPGPVLIDLPKDVAIAETTSAPVLPGPETSPPRADAAAIAQAKQMIAASRRPVIYGGGGIGIGNAVDAFRRFAKIMNVPVVTTLKALGAVPTTDENFLGMLGMHGTKAANHAVHDCDLLICVGARFDDRATGRLDSFASNAAVIHMDIDPSEIGKLREADVALCGDLNHSLDSLDAAPEAAEWLAECLTAKERHGMRYDAPGTGVYAPDLLRKLSLACDDELFICADVGQHQMWVAQHCHFQRPEHHLTSGGLGTMGFGIPAAIGTAMARPDATVVTVTGDGSIMMNLQELATIKRYNLPLKIVLIDNASLGMVRQWQELFFEERYSEVDLSDNPDFVQVAESLGVPAFRVDCRTQVDLAVKTLFEADGPMLAHVCIDPRANVWPLVPPGKSNAEMMEEEPTCGTH